MVKLAVTPTAGLSVTADASASYDNDQTPIARMVFNFGDETLVTTQWDSSASHTYADAGTYTVAVTVIDTAGLSATRTTTVTVG